MQYQANLIWFQIAFADTDITVGINAETDVAAYTDAATDETDDSANVPTSEGAVLQGALPTQVHLHITRWKLNILSSSSFVSRL